MKKSLVQLAFNPFLHCFASTQVPGTRSATIYQCTFIFIGMVNDLKGLNIGCLVDLHEHSRQTATRALKDGADEETVICGLLHDIGGKNSKPKLQC